MADARRQDDRLHRLHRRLRRRLATARFPSGPTSAGIKVVADESYNRADTSVTGQVLKILSANPDAVLIAGSGTPAATPQKELKARGYKGKIYQTHGVANTDFLRVCGKDGEGTWLPSGPMLVAEQLPDATRSRSLR